MLSKSDVGVTLSNDRPSMNKRDTHWSMIVREDGSKQRGRHKCRFQSIEDAIMMNEDLDEIFKIILHSFVSPLFLGHAHVIFAAIKTTSL
jgi:hypothetical protein